LFSLGFLIFTLASIVRPPAPGARRESFESYVKCLARI